MNPIKFYHNTITFSIQLPYITPVTPFKKCSGSGTPPEAFFFTKIVLLTIKYDLYAVDSLNCHDYWDTLYIKKLTRG